MCLLEAESRLPLCFSGRVLQTPGCVQVLPCLLLDSLGLARSGMSSDRSDEPVVWLRA